MKILVRLPNWLGDMVMSIGFISALQQTYPGATISVIAKKGIHTLLEFFPPIEHQFIFSKDEYPGLSGIWRFGRMIRKKEKFDLFFCLPDSFSSALMGFAAGAKKRIGHEKELRSVLLTDVYKKTGMLHRVREYTELLARFANKIIEPGEIALRVNSIEKKNRIIININSEASSRRLPLQKAVDLILTVHRSTASEIVLIGGKGDISFVETVITQLPDKFPVINLTGKTSLAELVKEIALSRVVLTTDSGPAHVANALGIYTVVLFGAGNENNTAPFNKKNRRIIRLGKLPCEPCVKNKCLLFGIPKCLELLDDQEIVQSLKLEV
ncbi:MAG: lipopolysaccharide heptosyltransferase II [Chitinophagaceae bacterium]